MICVLARPSENTSYPPLGMFQQVGIGRRLVILYKTWCIKQHTRLRPMLNVTCQHCTGLHRFTRRKIKTSLSSKGQNRIMGSGHTTLHALREWRSGGISRPLAAYTKQEWKEKPRSSSLSSWPSHHIINMGCPPPEKPPVYLYNTWLILEAGCAGGCIECITY